MAEKQGFRPLIFVGPSGIGKGTIEKKIMSDHPNCFAFSVSHTSRSPRAGEVDGKDYHFISRKQFEEDIAAGKFVEFCEIHGNLYGTSIAAIQTVTETGKICLLDLNIDGAVSLSKTNLNPYIIFFAPVSLESLEARLRGRGTESDSVIQTRMQTAKRELERLEELKSLWNCVIINDKIEDTMKKINQILKELYELEPTN